MNPDEKSRMAEELRESHAALLQALEGATDDAARRRPAPDRWSALDCVEHLVIAERYLFGQLQQARPGGAADPKREERIRRFGANRSRPMQAPEGAQPTGRYATLAAALEDFGAARAGTIGFVLESAGDLRASAVEHPVLGSLNSWEMLLTIVAHPHRHASQIREALAA